jgi:hypothetical protein
MRRTLPRFRERLPAMLGDMWRYEKSLAAPGQ